MPGGLGFLKTIIQVMEHSGFSIGRLLLPGFRMQAFFLI